LIDRLNFGDLIGLFEALALMNKAVLERLKEAVVKFDVDAVKEACDDALADLGADVPPRKFQEEAEKLNVRIVGMSALLTTTMVKMADTIKALVEAGIRDRAKVILR
jgi:cobalamin-dependent methionine synthase I